MKKNVIFVLILSLLFSSLAVNVFGADRNFVDEEKVEAKGYTVWGMSEFHEGLAVVQTEKGDWNYINEDYKLVDLNKGRFEYVYPFFEGLAAVVDKNWKVGYINKKGDIVIPCQFGICHYQGDLCTGFFKDGVATVFKENYNFTALVEEWELANINGVTPPEMMVAQIDTTGKIVKNYWNNSNYSIDGLHCISEKGGYYDSDYTPEEQPVETDKEVYNQSTLRLTDWFPMDTGHVVYYAIKNELKAEPNVNLIDTSRYALILYNPNTSVDILSAEVHFLDTSFLHVGESNNGNFYTQFSGEYVINNSIKSILVKFDSDEDIETFKAEIPMAETEDKMQKEYLVDSSAKGEKWLTDTFHVKLKWGEN